MMGGLSLTVAVQLGPNIERTSFDVSSPSL